MEPGLFWEACFPKQTVGFLNITDAVRGGNSANGPVSLQVPAVRLRPRALPAVRHAALRAGVRGRGDTAAVTGDTAAVTCPGPAEHVSTRE